MTVEISNDDLIELKLLRVSLQFRKTSECTEIHAQQIIGNKRGIFPVTSEKLRDLERQIAALDKILKQARA